MRIVPRPGGQAAIRKLVLHLNVGPDVEGGARLLSDFLDHQDAGYHEVGDDKESIEKAAPDRMVEAASGMNLAGWHYCVVANLQTPAQWADPYSAAEIDLAARVFAQKCHEFGLPPVLLTDAQIADPNARGICDHWGVNRAIVKPAVARGDHSMGPGDHTDVGAGFPWPIFIAKVVAYYGGSPLPTSKDEPMLYPIHPKKANKFSGALVDLPSKTLVAVGGAKLTPDPKVVNNPLPWIGSYAVPGGLVIVTKDLDTYQFALS